MSYVCISDCVARSEESGYISHTVQVSDTAQATRQVSLKAGNKIEPHSYCTYVCT